MDRYPVDRCNRLDQCDECTPSNDQCHRSCAVDGQELIEQYAILGMIQWGLTQELLRYR